MDPGGVRDVLTVATGVATGVLSGLFGVGGAVISTPAIRALGASASVAVGTTLPAIIPGALSGTAKYVRNDLVDRRAVIATAPTGIAMAIVGALLADVVPGDGHILMLLTAALLGFSAFRMGKPPAEPDVHDADSDAELAEEPTRPQEAPTMRLAGVGAISGLLSGLLGIGGGVVMVPAFTQIIGMPVKKAIGTSLACVALFAVSGTITHAIEGNIDWRFGLLLAVGVVPGARLGAGLTIGADDRRLRLIVALFLGFTAILYGAGEILALAD